VIDIQITWVVRDDGVRLRLTDGGFDKLDELEMRDRVECDVRETSCRDLLDAKRRMSAMEIVIQVAIGRSHRSGLCATDQNAGGNLDASLSPNVAACASKQNLVIGVSHDKQDAHRRAPLSQQSTAATSRT
jgi:hypothetical protein